MKVEFFKERNWDKRKHLHILAIHGANDQIVSGNDQKDSIEIARRKGLNATFVELKAGHKLTRAYLIKIRQWLIELGYETSDS